VYMHDLIGGGQPSLLTSDPAPLVMALLCFGILLTFLLLMSHDKDK